MEEPLQIPKINLIIQAVNLEPILNPHISLSQRNEGESEFTQLGKTEVQHKNTDPEIDTNFLLDFQFETQTHLLIQLFSTQDKSQDLTQDKCIGQCSTTLGEIIGTPGQQVKKKLVGQNGTQCGQVILKAVNRSKQNEKIQLLWGGADLDDVAGFFLRFWPFFSILRIDEDNTAQRIYTSEAATGTSPVWKIFDITTEELCEGDENRPLFIEVCDHSSLGNHELVGTGQLTLNEVKDRGLRNIRLINAQKLNEERYKDSGLFVIKQMDIIRQTTFLDYIAGGCSINLIGAVDFTSSNGNPLSSDSLHYLDPSGPNQYETALAAVGNILLNYDTDKLVPMFGFGGTVKGELSHWFHMNFNSENPEVKEMSGIMNSYRNSLNSVELSGPTLYSHVLKKVIEMTEAENIGQQNQQYFVLLILTDGEIHDMQETIDLIVRGSHLPLSIVIVGLGDEQFDNMMYLDADSIPLVATNGQSMERDIVQFVPYRDVGNDPNRLAKEVLDEIPREIVNYFTQHGIYPNNENGNEANEIKRRNSLNNGRSQEPRLKRNTTI